MGVRSKDHFSTACKILSHVLMNNCNVRWYINSAIFLCCGKAEHVIIFVDGSTYCTEGIVAVCKYIRDREFFHSGCLGCLDDSYKCDIVGSHCIEFEFQVFHVSGGVVCLHDAVSHGALSCFRFLCFFSGECFHFGCFCFRYDFCSVYQICAAII